MASRRVEAAADGSYASRDNLRHAKARGVRDMAFHKRGGLSIEHMVRSCWVYRKLRNFRAGIEADISCLKRAYGLARCTWRGLGHFRAYVCSAVVAYNLALFAHLSRSEAIHRRHEGRPANAGRALGLRSPRAPPPSPFGCAASTPRAHKTSSHGAGQAL